MPEYVEIQDARDLPGMRLVLTAGVPGPFGEAAKAIFHVKKIRYTPVRQTPGQSDDALRAWTAQTSAPVAVYGDERPRSGWADILYLAERVAPEPRLIPEEPAQRLRMFGLANEVCGEEGFAWQRRLTLLEPLLAGGGGEDAPGEGLPQRPGPLRLEEGVPALLGRKYGYSPEAAAAAPARTTEILGTLSSELRDQQRRGSRFFVGDTLSALDLYWATFAAMIEPLPPELCPMNQGLRAGYTLSDPKVREAADPLLLEHRDAIYRDYLELPLDF